MLALASLQLKMRYAPGSAPSSSLRPSTFTACHISQNRERYVSTSTYSTIEDQECVGRADIEWRTLRVVTTDYCLQNDNTQANARAFSKYAPYLVAFSNLPSSAIWVPYATLTHRPGLAALASSRHLVTAVFQNHEAQVG